jgi:preprotein translocase subunit SecF
MMSRLGQVGGRLYRGEISFDFVGKRKLWYSISGVILLLSLILVLVKGLDFSVEFKGGAIFTVNKASASISQTEVLKAASDGGIDGAIVQSTHGTSGTNWTIQTPTVNEEQSTTLQNTLVKELGVPQSSISVDSVGASWGGQISDKALQALIAFLIVIVIYLTIAFEWKMAASAFVALLHTLVITVGVYALTGFQVSPATVIGFLTILGYALYDTVVVFDKVRENTAGLLGSNRQSYSEAANLALNQTLVRSINTTLIALLPVGSILFAAGIYLSVGELKDLSLVLFVGILAGAYASICIATPVLTQLKEREPQYQALAKRVALRGASPKAERRTEARAGTGSRRTTASAQAQVIDEDMRDPQDEDLADDLTDDLTDDTQSTPVVVSRPPSSGTGTGAVSATARPGPRQQPRRDGRASATRGRPAGKKKRR